MIKRFSVEEGGKRLELEICTKDADTHSWVTDHQADMEKGLEYLKAHLRVCLFQWQREK